MSNDDAFSGFPAGTIRFLRDLEKNNDRDWFNDNKTRYEENFVDPSLAFIAAMAKPLSKISKQMLAIPKKQGGSLMRIYRDTRFSKDKSPYKTNIGIQFRHQSGKDVHAPGFYLHIQPKEVFVGAGVWHPESKLLAAIRSRIDESPKVWTKARDDSAFQEHFALEGESLKRPPRGFDPEHPHIEDLKRKDFMAVKRLKESAIRSEDFVDQIAASLKASKPLMRFICDAVDIPF